MTNEDVRQKAASAGIKLWQIADALHMTDGNFSRKLRKELSAETKEQIYSIIRELSGEVGA